MKHTIRTLRLALAVAAVLVLTTQAAQASAAYVPPDLPHIVNTQASGYQGTYRPSGHTSSGSAVAGRQGTTESFDWLAAMVGGTAVVLIVGGAAAITARNRRRIAISG